MTTTLYPPYGMGVYGLAYLAAPPVQAAHILTPAGGSTVNNPGFLVTWERVYLAGSGAQNDYRLRIADLAATVLYDSGSVVSTSEEATVPDAWPAVAGDTFLLRVTGTDEHGYPFDSGWSEFEAAWTTPPAVAGLTVTPTDTGLPHNLLEWDAVDTTGVTDSTLRVYRRTAAAPSIWPGAATDPAGPWVRIAIDVPITPRAYRDYGAAAGVEYEYAVTHRGNTDGVNSESAKQSPPPDATLTWRYGYMHDPQDTAIYTRLLARELNPTERQSQAHHAVAGRAAGVTFVGEGQARTFALQLIPEQVGDMTTYQRLTAMQRRQFEPGATYCLRLGHSGEVVYGTIAADLGRSDRPGLYETGFVLNETSYTEAV